MKIRIVPVEDLSILQELVISHLDAVPGQVRVLETDIHTEAGPVILGLDHERRLVVLVLSLIKEDDLLSRVLGIYGWVLQNLSLISRFYAKRGLDGTRDPRIMVIAPGYLQTVLNGLPHLSVSLELYLYRGLEVNGEKALLLEAFGGSIPEPEVEAPAEPKTTRDFLKATELTEEEIRFFQESRPSGSAA
jgi:hypothetical protein